MCNHIDYYLVYTVTDPQTHSTYSVYRCRHCGYEWRVYNN